MTGPSETETQQALIEGLVLCKECAGERVERTGLDLEREARIYPSVCPRCGQRRSVWIWQEESAGIGCSPLMVALIAAFVIVAFAVWLFNR